MTIRRVIAKFCPVLLSLSTAFTKQEDISVCLSVQMQTPLLGQNPTLSEATLKIGSTSDASSHPMFDCWKYDFSGRVSQCRVSIISIKLVVGQSGSLLEACYGGAAAAAAQGIKTPLLFLPHNLTPPLFTSPSSSSPLLLLNNQNNRG